MLRFTSFYPTLVPQGKIECLESSPVGKPPGSWARTRSWSCTCTPPPARATCLKMSKQTVSNLAIVPDDRLVAVDVETLLGRVLDVAEGIVGVGGGSVPVCAVFFIFKDWQGKGLSSLSNGNFQLKKYFVSVVV